ncbi:hypothetical protein BU24DRAFT_116250 [Aaosphaeria arxii CBS 175.79]|uniref:Uncharacterized protein n=1 Tax=Aaosphaeria arxii CBS 175.79 TaxID=1450172 RepID=A0A6A5Y256_9PLEO|nr:uncharacterized protein BU24DRAFT_116250 [Aaosphaeria arxii CBS 175.79]KAF2019303.1 hypothetical protein BU24DRAFT_116250 [Aaosphaeria arxii CBS 175.79]
MCMEITAVVWNEISSELWHSNELKLIVRSEVRLPSFFKRAGRYLLCSCLRGCISGGNLSYGSRFFTVAAHRILPHQRMHSQSIIIGLFLLIWMLSLQALGNSISMHQLIEKPNISALGNVAWPRILTGPFHLPL